MTWFIRENLQVLNNLLITKTKVLLSQTQVTLTDFWLSPLGTLVFFLPTELFGFPIFWLCAYSRNESCALNQISTFLFVRNFIFIYLCGFSEYLFYPIFYIKITLHYIIYGFWLPLLVSSNSSYITLQFITFIYWLL